ncbi:MAG: hypothetical protein OYH77_03640 [Pseudomonadota bacterium]|nr:hypothetical protein [Pseudomonadota bacterium]
MLLLVLAVYLSLYGYFFQLYRKQAQIYGLAHKTVATTLEAYSACDYRVVNSLDDGRAYHPIGKTLKNYMYRGLLQVQALQILFSAVADASRGHQENQLALMLFFLRVGAVLLLSGVGNLLLSFVLPTMAFPWWAHVATVALMLAMFYLCKQSFPPHWLWRHGSLSGRGSKWVHALFSTGVDLDARLLALEQRAISQGIDVRQQRFGFLTAWRDEQERLLQQAKAQRHDFMPLLELAALGGLASLQLYPVLHLIIKSMLDA